MSNHIVVSSISYAPISGTDQEVMEQTHKDLEDLVGRVAQATRARSDRPARDHLPKLRRGSARGADDPTAGRLGPAV